MGYCVYKHTAPNGKVYIGQTCQQPEQRWKNGKGYSNNEYFTRAIQKYGWDNFQHEVLYDNLTKAEADALEIELIAKYNSTDNKYGFNIENGGYGKGKHSSETLKKMSVNRKGVAAWNKNIPMSEEQRKYLSKIRKGRKSSFRGKTHSEEAKKKIFESQIKNMKSVLCVETDTVYTSLKEAERETGVSSKHIGKVCSGKMYNGKRYLTAGGYHWKYCDS